MKLVRMRCPNCNATLEFDIEGKTSFCQYCGEKLLLDDEKITINYNETKTHRTVDEARIKEAEVRRDIRMKELNIEESSTKQSLKTLKPVFILLLIVGLLGLGLGAYSLLFLENDKAIGIILFSFVIFVLGLAPYAQALDDMQKKKK